MGRPPFVGFSERVPSGRPIPARRRHMMKYLILGAMTETGQQLGGLDLEGWMAEIGAWYEKYGSSGKLADAGHQLDSPDKAKTIRAGGVTAGPFMEAEEFLAGCAPLESSGIDECGEVAEH